MAEDDKPNNSDDQGRGASQPAQAQMFSVPRLPSGQSLGAKFFVLGLLVVILSIPLFAVWLLVKDREDNYRRAVAEIGHQWGGEQTVVGPLLAVPATVLFDTQDDRGRAVQRRVRETILIAPETLAVDGSVDPERRKRGIHEAIVYQSKLAVSAQFARPDLDNLDLPVASVDWERASLIMSISDLKGIETVSIARDGAELDAVEPGLSLTSSNAEPGFHVALDLAEVFGAQGGGVTSFAIDLAFKGSQTLHFAPVGRQSSVALQSAWPHPSFSGALLPVNRQVETTGFSAQWSVPQLARAIPAITLAGSRDAIGAFGKAYFGVDLYQPVDFYRYVDRAVKYGVLFVGAAFLVIFAIEVMSKGRMHLAHYMMTGLMVVIFYVLLLALAEMIGFAAAYGIAAGATGAVLAGFTASLFAGRLWTMAAFAGFALLYGVLYIVLSLEDAALLAGAVTGFVILTAMMFGTRKVDWSLRPGTRPPSA